MDLREEQQIEIETLLSIYPDEMTCKFATVRFDSPPNILPLLSVLTVENSDPEVPETFVESNDERSQFTLKISSSEATSGDTGMGSMREGVFVTVFAFLRYIFLRMATAGFFSYHPQNYHSLDIGTACAQTNSV